MVLFYIILCDCNPPYPALGSNIPSARRPGQRFHFLQCRGSSPSLPFVNRYGGTVRKGRVGCLHRNIFTRKVTDIAFACDFCNNHSHPASLRPCVPVFDVPASPSHTSPRPILDVLKSLVSRPHVPSPHTRIPMFPSHFYTQPMTDR